MWQARTKTDLIIEVWEKLDCENVGAAEIEAIEEVIRDRYGEAAVDSPMQLARLLADEGAELRHSEIMDLWIERSSDRPYDAAFRNLIDLKDMRSSLTTLRNLENLRRKYASDGDKTGLRHIREAAIHAKSQLREAAEDPKLDALSRRKSIEIAQWFTVWLQTPTIFDSWIDMRQRARDFIDQFGYIRRDEPS